MTYQNKFCTWLQFSCILLGSFSCSYSNQSKGDLVKIDTVEINGYLFSNEEIFIRANDSLIYHKAMDDSKKIKTFYNVFFLSKQDIVNLSILTTLNGKKYIDTAFTILPSVHIRSIGGSICYPSNLSEDSLRKIEPHWGFIPIDSCKRYFTIMPDSITDKYPMY